MKFLAVLVFVGMLSSDFPTSVAARCTGEASFAVALCACTVKNRLDAGWSRSKVLSSYYARSIPPTAKAVETARAVLAGEQSCPKDAYYLFSRTDIRYLGLREENASARVCSRARCVYSFPRNALRRR